MALTKIGSIGINTGIQFAGVTTIATLNASDNVLSVGGTVNFTSDRYGFTKTSCKNHDYTR